MKKIIIAESAPKAIGPYSQAVEADGWLFLSGQIPMDPATGQVIPGGIQAQTERVLKNMEAVLKAAGMAQGNVVKTTVYMTNLADFPAMNEVYGRFFKESPPARATVQVEALPKDVSIEIEAIAKK